MSKKISRRSLLATSAAGATLAALPLAAQQSTLHKIDIKGFKFIPASLEVRPGDRIRWTNRDSAPHDATADDRGWRTEVLRRGNSGEVTVTADMDTNYFCSIHPNMRARLTIVS